MAERFNMHKNENEMIFEGYLNEAGNAMNQQDDFQKMKFRPAVGKSNYSMFAGLNTSFKTFLALKISLFKLGVLYGRSKK